MEESSKPKFFHLIPTDLNIDFLKISKPFVWLSTIAVILSIVGVFTKGLNFGLDFAGGAEVEVRVNHGWDLHKVREVLSGGGIADASVVQIGAPEDSEFLVKIKSSAPDLNAITKKVESVLSQASQGAQLTILRSDIVGALAGDQLRRAALISLFYAALGILIYISLRFDFRFAPGIVRALLLDVVVVVGAWVLMQKEFNLNTVAALLTIAGYSCNDTIVIYDRIREFSKKHKDWTLYQVVNRSINLNLGRTVITIMCTLFVVIALWIWGGPILSDFALAMMLGFAISAYSTIFVANPMILFMEKHSHSGREATAKVPAGASR
jgi:preprotein translocase subunit SecF